MFKLCRFIPTGALVLISCFVFAQHAIASDLFAGQQFTDKDSVLVVDSSNKALFAWQADSKRIPASIMKLFTAWLAIEKWGLDHQFSTEFYIDGNTLWIKGLGDPVMISEEVDLLVEQVRQKLPINIDAVGVDSSLFADVLIPGKGQTNDPYNAPLSALAINFNTVSVAKVAGVLQSGESQTPLTPVAKSLASHAKVKLGTRASRINLVSARNAGQQFAEVFIDKLGVNGIQSISHGRVPSTGTLFYRHQNSQNLEKVVRGALEYSNNFVANQLFMMLGERDENQNLTLQGAQDSATRRLADLTGWQGEAIVEGAGLSRANQFSAGQILTVLNGLEPYKELLKRYELKSGSGRVAYAYAKSGTLDGVHTFAGYLKIDDQDHKFVFLFNRTRPYRFRETLLQELANDLGA